jgi:hypothetical protein
MTATNETSTALHESAHAVLGLILRMDVAYTEMTQLPDGRWEGQTGLVDGETGRDPLPADSAWLRLATAWYAGAEASRRGGEPDWDTGAGSASRAAERVVTRITSDPDSVQLLQEAARRRSKILALYYWPEIEAVARELQVRGRLERPDLERIIDDSLNSRAARRIEW